MLLKTYCKTYREITYRNTLHTQSLNTYTFLYAIFYFTYKKVPLLFFPFNYLTNTFLSAVLFMFS